MKKMKILLLLLVTIIIELEGVKFIKPFRPNEPSQRFRPALTHSAIHMNNRKKHSKPTIPDGIEPSHNPYDDNIYHPFVQDYKKNIEQLISIDPCLFSPCGGNTVCVEKHHHSSTLSYRVLSRVCYCYYGFIPHPRISETCARPCDLQDCGANASCMNDANGRHNCVCNPGYLPVIHGTSHFKGCGDPCQSLKCNPSSTVCIAISANERVCLCQEGTVPKNGNAAKFGCEMEPVVPDPCKLMPCNQLNTLCIPKSQKERYCICKEGHITKGGDAETQACIPNPCMQLNACGSKTICSLTADLTKICTCQPGFLLVDDNTEEKEGCHPDPCLSAQCGDNSFCDIKSGSAVCVCYPGFFKDNSEVCINLCDDSPCSTVMNAECLSITATKFDCICPSGTKPSDGVNPDNGCVIYCNYQGFEILDGMSLILPDLSAVTCTDGEIVTTTEPPVYATTCDSPFMAVQGGCYYVSPDTEDGKETAADDARQKCLAENGDLAGPPDINDGNSYYDVLTALGVTGTTSEFWVGLKQSAEGQPFYQLYPNPDFAFLPLTSPLWEIGQPNGPNFGGDEENCARLKIFNGRYRVQDKPCTGSSSYRYLCVIPNLTA